MANLNDNEYGITFRLVPLCQRNGETHYDIALPDGRTTDDALAVAIGKGYKTKSDATWFEPYASIRKTVRIVRNRQGKYQKETGHRLVITHPNLD